MEKVLSHTLNGEFKKITVGDVPQEDMTTTDELYDNGRRVTGGKTGLEQASFYHADISADIGLYVVPKRSPYLAEPALDNMVYVAKERGAVKSIDQLDADELKETFTTIFKLQQAYEQLAPIQAHVLSTSFHANPIYDQSIFGKKVHAQSLRDLHFHAFSFSKKEVDTIKTTPRQSLGKNFQDYMDDPLNSLIKGLTQEQSLIKRLLGSTSTLQSVGGGPAEGVRFSFDHSSINNLSFYRDIQQIHANINGIYEDIANLFVDLSEIDNKQMPKRLPTIESEERVTKFIEGYSITSAENRRRLMFLARNLKAGEDVSSLQERVFLRGCAYTMFMGRHAGEPQRDLYFAPRIVSTGNALSSLGFFYQKEPIIDAGWISLRDRRQEEIGKLLNNI